MITPSHHNVPSGVTLTATLIGTVRHRSSRVAFKAPGFSVGLASSFSHDIQDCIYTGSGAAHLHWEWGFGGSYTSTKAAARSCQRSDSDGDLLAYFMPGGCARATPLSWPGFRTCATMTSGIEGQVQDGYG